MIKRSFCICIMIIGLGVIASVPAAAEFDPTYDENFDVIPLPAVWEPNDPNVYCDTNSHPGYATLRDLKHQTTGGIPENGVSDVFVHNRTFYDYGGTAEWDLEVRIIPIPQVIPPGVPSIYLMSGIGICSGPKFDYYNGFTFGYAVGRVSLPDTMIYVSMLKDAVMAYAPETGFYNCIWRDSVSDAGNNSYVKEVFLRVQKRNSDANEIADNGRFYCSWQATIDPNDGFNPPYTTDWFLMCWKTNANNLGSDLDGDGDSNDLVISLYGNAIGYKEILFDYIKIRPKGVAILPEFCGDVHAVYKQWDLNEDCKVDFADYSRFAKDWMVCTDPNNPLCN